MKPKILVAYASKSGSTVDVAQAIGESLSHVGVAVDMIPVRQIKSLDGYDGVILGSAIRMGSWLPEAKAFVGQHHVELSAVPTAIFTVHLLNLDDSPESQAARASYVAPIREYFTPAEEVFFAGRLEMARLSLFERLLSKAMKAVEQDLRDFDAISAWAAQIGPVLISGGDRVAA